MIQDLTFETGDLGAFEQVLRVAVELVGCRHLIRITSTDRIDQYPSHSAAYLRSFVGNPMSGDVARYVYPDQRPPAWYQPLCRLSDRPDTHGLEEHVAGDDVMIRTMELLRAVDRDKFDRETGEGPFQGCEGSVGSGFRLNAGALGRAGDLLITLCHIYYSK